MFCLSTSPGLSLVIVNRVWEGVYCCLGMITDVVSEARARELWLLFVLCVRVDVLLG